MRWPLACLLVTSAAVAAPPAAVRIAVPSATNLQYMAFWTAKGAGFFRDEGLDVTTAIPISPVATTQLVLETAPDAAVLPPPQALELIDRDAPIVLVANLLRNDPIDLVVKRRIFEERHLDAKAPLAERLRGLHGLRIGVAPHPPPRLRALFAAAGLDVEREVKVEVFPGPQQNAAFADGSVDALYCHTPFLERALLDQDGVVLVDQLSGEVPVLSARQIHTLGVARSLMSSHPERVEALVRAIARSERLIHDDPAATVEALARELPSIDRPHLAKAVSLYAPAIPLTPAVSVEGLRVALQFFPEGKPVPDLSGKNLASFVDDRFAERAQHGRLIRPWMALPPAAVLLLLAVALRRRRGKPASA